MPAMPGRIPEGQGPQTRAEGQRVLHAWGERGRRRRTPALHFEMTMTMTTMCVCVYLCDALCVRVCVGVSVWVRTCVYVCVCMCVHVWVRANVHVINMQDANLEGGWRWESAFVWIQVRKLGCRRVHSPGCGFVCEQMVTPLWGQKKDLEKNKINDIYTHNIFTKSASKQFHKEKHAKRPAG